MSNRARTPNTPFIPPLNSPEGSPQPPPVIPPHPSPGYSGYGPLPGAGSYAYPHSPYSSTPFIPPAQIVTPGVVPSNLPPSRQGVSSDYIGFSVDNPNPLASPAMNPYPMGPMGPAPGAWGGAFPNSPISPQSPYSPYAQQFGGPPPGQYPLYNTPHGPPPAHLQSTPWGGAQPLPQQGHYTPFGRAPPNLPPHGPPPLAGGWGGGAPPPQQGYFPPPAQEPLGWGGGGFGIPRPPPPPEPPVNPKDGLDHAPPFARGPHYGPVLEPFIAHVVQANIKTNPLISCLPDDGSDQVHLKWNMLFPTSTIQRSDDKPYVSWLNGRDDPATYPRITSLRIVTDTIPWMIEVKAQNKDLGVTCGEVIESICHELVKFSNKADFMSLSTHEQRDVSAAYTHNRSRDPSVPGGMLGTGMKRLDFLRRNTMFGGIEKNDNAVKRITGEALPCTFVMRCLTAFPMTQQERQDQEARMRANSAHPSPNMKARSRAGSMSARGTPSGGRISVVPPSSSDSDDDGDVDYDHHR
ncbi:hypothetical protein CVT26_015780 [Gymnopilus dilepis]|uniref:DUF6699 domain-containing protein n=1 Tax=Gymnopilus dilepis TaxID=231916 RepID=A0A409WMA3_9AGAR|nr:hypothetical protein CVT26_015780 [Gymnopilus dilepis]